MANDQFQGVEKFLPGLTAARVRLDDGGGASHAYFHADGIATNGNSATTGDVRVGQIAWGGEAGKILQPLGGTMTFLVDVTGY